MSLDVRAVLIVGVIVAFGCRSERQPSAASSTPESLRPTEPPVADPPPSSVPAPTSVQPPLPPPPDPPFNVVAAAALEPLRLAGDRDILPDEKARKAIVDSGKRARPSFKVCLDVHGNVTSTAMLKTSGFPDYDALIIEQLKNWRFRPYERNGAPAPACSAFTFAYPKADPESSSKHEADAKGGFWCVTYSTGSGPSSGCGRDLSGCQNARSGVARSGMGATDLSECERRDTVWASRIKTNGKTEDWFFAEKQHCENTALVFRGTPCKARSR